MNRTRFLRLVALCGIIGLILTPLAFWIIDLFDWLPISLNENIFSDFAETLSYCIVDNPYNVEDEIRTIYSPLCYLHLYPFALLAKEPIEEYIAIQSQGYSVLNLIEVSHTWQIRLGYCLYYLINLTLLCLVLWKMSKFKGWDLAYLMVIAISYSCLFECFIRGNVIIVTILSAMVFFWLYDSERRWQREVSLLCLGLAVSMKIFPAFLALLLLQKRRYLDIVKAAIYSILLYVLPFLFVSGGLSNILSVIQNMTGFSSENTPLIGFTCLSIKAMVYRPFWVICYFFQIDDSIFMPYVNVITWILRIALLAFALFSCFYFRNSRKKMQLSYLFVSLVLFIPSISYFYNGAYMLYPFLLFVNDYEEYEPKDRLFYSLCYAMMVPALSNSGAGVPFCIILFVLEGKVIYDLLKEKRQQKEEKALSSEGKEGV